MQGFGAVKCEGLALLQDGFILVASIPVVYMRCMTTLHTEFAKCNTNMVDAHAD